MPTFQLVYSCGDKSLLTSSFQEIDSHKAEEERGRINKKEFLELYKDVSTRPEVYFLMVRYANKDYLTCEDLQMFLETEQGVMQL